MALTAETIDRLKSQLLTSGLSQKDNALFQVINLLIDATRQSLIGVESLGGISTPGSGIPPALASTFVTTGPEQGTLPNSRQIQVMGLGVNMTNRDYIISNSFLPGMDGEDGDIGPIGPVGPQGPTGATGPSGSGSAALMAILDEVIDVETPLPLGNIPSPGAGVWTNVTYAAGDFTAASGTWTVDAGDVISFKYCIVGNIMIMSYALNTTSYSGAAGNELRVKIPGGRLAKTTDVLSAIRANDNGTDTVGFNGCVAAANYIRNWRSGFANWDNTSVNNTTVQGEALFEI